MVLCFTKDDKFIIIGDKTGEVYRYSTKDWATSGEHLLGHFSMLLDMVSEYGGSKLWWGETFCFVLSRFYPLITDM